MPQTRGELTPKQVERIAAAMQAVENATHEREQAIADALKAGASVREIAAFTGMSPTTVQKIGHMNGWPTATQKQRRSELATERDAWRRYTSGDKA